MSPIQVSALMVEMGEPIRAVWPDGGVYLSFNVHGVFVSAYRGKYRTGLPLIKQMIVVEDWSELEAEIRRITPSLMKHLGVPA